jgi:hypothetical protein
MTTTDLTPVHIMLDIETMGTRPGAAIVAIGACTFGDGLNWVRRRQFRATITLDGQQQRGLHLDEATVTWWLRQSDAARQALTMEGGVQLGTALFQFNDFVNAARDVNGEQSPVRMWGNGANFDPPVIEAAYRACMIKPAWGFRDARCLRTLLDLAQVDMKAFRHGTAHDALDDAMSQAFAAEAAFATLKARNDG